MRETHPVDPNLLLASQSVIGSFINPVVFPFPDCTTANAIVAIEGATMADHLRHMASELRRPRPLPARMKLMNANGWLLKIGPLRRYCRI